MIDIHCHILPAVDDGAEDLNEAVSMSRMAASSGVKTIIATPHCNLPMASEKNYLSTSLRDRFIELYKAVRSAGIDLSILPGAEVLCTPDLPELLQQRKLLTLAGSRYLLVEFLFDESIHYMDAMLDTIVSHGMTPIIAHPERYETVQRHPEDAVQWFQRGYLLQVNKGSILGSLGRRSEIAADWLLSRGLAHAAASDAHSFHSRTPRLDELRSYLEQAYSPAYARLLLSTNPQRILKDQPVLTFR